MGKGSMTNRQRYVFLLGASLVCFAAGFLASHPEWFA